MQQGHILGPKTIADGYGKVLPRRLEDAVMHERLTDERFRNMVKDRIFIRADVALYRTEAWLYSACDNERHPPLEVHYLTNGPADSVDLVDGFTLDHNPFPKKRQGQLDRFGAWRKGSVSYPEAWWSTEPVCISHRLGRVYSQAYDHLALMSLAQIQPLLHQAARKQIAGNGYDQSFRHACERFDKFLRAQLRGAHEALLSLTGPVGRPS